MSGLTKSEWKFIAAGWSVYAVYMTIASYVINERLGRPITWLTAIVNDFSYSLLWLLLTPLVLMLARRFRFEKGRLGASIAVHLTASILLAFLHKAAHWIALSVYLSAMQLQTFSWDPLYRNLLAFYDYGLLLYWIVLAANYIGEYYTRYRSQELAASQLETQLAQAQLHALKMQLHPHFLFNALHTIAGLVRSDEKQKAVKMIAGLSDLLRATLDRTNEQEVTLQQELDMVKKYLDIEQVRFSDCLTTELRIDPSTLHALVPGLVLQPLVENAVRHGLTPSTIEAGCRITISSMRENGSLLIEVRDNGSGLSDEPSRKEGIGLANTRARLERLYGKGHGVDLSSVPGGGVSARLSIPWHTKTNGQHDAGT